MIKKNIFIIVIVFLFITSIQCKKYNYKIVDGKYKIDDLNEFIVTLKKALKEKDKETILKLSQNDIGYDIEENLEKILTTKKILNNNFNYELCLKMLNYKYEIKGSSKRPQVSFPPEKRDIDEKYTLFLEYQIDKGWLFMGIFDVPYSLL